MLNNGNIRWEPGAVHLQLREATGDWWGASGGRVSVQGAVEVSIKFFLKRHPHSNLIKVGDVAMGGGFKNVVQTAGEGGF